MTLRNRWQIMSVLPITAVIVGIGMFAPSTAQAECGSYIVYTNPAHRAVDPQPMGEHQSPVPCHGPSCSQSPPPAPIPNTPPTIRILGDDPLVTVSGMPFVSPSSDSISSDPHDGDVIRRVADVYHPPR